MNHDEREPLEALSQLAPSARYLHRRRWSHAEAGMLLAGLRCELVWLAYAKFLGDAESERLLIAWVYQHAAGLAAAEGWKIERGVQGYAGWPKSPCGRSCAARSGIRSGSWQRCSAPTTPTGGGLGGGGTGRCVRC